MEMKIAILPIAAIISISVILFFILMTYACSLLEKKLEKTLQENTNKKSNPTTDEKHQPNKGKIMKTLISLVTVIAIILAALTASGCSSNQIKNIHPMEYAWQGLHIIDVQQTINGVGSWPDCFDEGNPLTSRIIGTKPEKHEIYKWGIGAGLLNFVIMKWVDNKMPNHNLKLRIASVLNKADTVHGNYEEGIRMDGLSSKKHKECKKIADARKNQAIRLEFKF